MSKIKECEECGMEYYSEALSPTSFRHVFPEIKRLLAEKAELQSLFDLQHKRTLEADRLYQKAHNQPENVFPDLGKLIEWLLSMAGSCYSCEHGPKIADTPKICSGCSFAMSNPKDGVNRWEPKNAKQ